MLARFSAWFKRIPPAVTIIGTLASIGFCVVYILITFDIVRRPCDPAVHSVGSEAKPGQQVALLGECPDVVTEIRLVGNGASFRVPFISASMSRLLLTIHDEIPRGTYHLEFKTSAGTTIVPRRSLSVILPESPPPKPPPDNIIFANLNWDSGRLQTAIARFIIENGYGYQTSLLPSRGAPIGAADVWKALRRGKSHIAMEI